MKRKGVCWLAVAAILVISLALISGCSSSDGSDGLSAYQIAVNNGFEGTEQDWLDSLAGGGGTAPGDGSWFGEYCTSCHADDGQFHQAKYDQLYQDGVIQVTNPAYANTGGNDIVTFQMTKNGNAFDCEAVENLNIYFAPYTVPGFELATGRLSIKGTVVWDEDTNVCTSTNAASALGDLSGDDALVLVYGRDETISQIPGTRVNQARYPYAAVLDMNDSVDYVSAANNDGCEKCHTVPFLKHGYIYGQVAGDPATDFFVCKACHLDDGDGGHFIWQLLVDDAELIIELEEEFGEDWEELAADDPRLAKYQYKTSLKNDVHMSHAQEFPYPQSMSNCATCHDGKLGSTLTQANFTLETCKSCHPVTDANGLSIMDAPALLDLAPSSHSAYIDTSDYSETVTCNGCHTDVSAVAFNEIHTGYNPVIYTDVAGTKISEDITVSIDSAALNGYTLSIAFSASGTATNGAGIALDSVDILPGLLVGLYGQATKDFLVGPHARDIDGDRNLEFDVTQSAAGTWNTHPRFLVDPSSTPGAWVVTADLSHWANLIDDGTIFRAEIAVLPELVAIVGEDDSSPAGSNEDDDYVVALNAVSNTFVFAGDVLTEPFAGIVSVEEGCNNCHDALATTFHGPDRGGSIEVCRLCHITLSGGSHLEMQSRSIDSYIHAIHSFQPFDVGGSSGGNLRGPDFTDPVEELHFEHHIGFVYPTLGFDCESCHNEGTYDVPSQEFSMPGLLSPANDALTYGGWDRDIVPADFPESVTGPAGRACGSCHKVGFINHDDAAGLADLNQHIENYGYLWENDSDDVILGFIVDMVFSIYP